MTDVVQLLVLLPCRIELHVQEGDPVRTLGSEDDHLVQAVSHMFETVGKLSSIGTLEGLLNTNVVLQK